MSYPTDLVEKAQYELEVFERVGRETSLQLLEEVVAWRTRLPEEHYVAKDGKVLPKK